MWHDSGKDIDLLIDAPIINYGPETLVKLFHKFIPFYFKYTTYLGLDIIYFCHHINSNFFYGFTVWLFVVMSCTLNKVNILIIEHFKIFWWIYVFFLVIFNRFFYWFYYLNSVKMFRSSLWEVYDFLHNFLYVYCSSVYFLLVSGDYLEICTVYFINFTFYMTCRNYHLLYEGFFLSYLNFCIVIFNKSYFVFFFYDFSLLV